MSPEPSDDLAFLKPAARQYHRAAFMAFDHAKQHAEVSGDLDAAQVILSLDFGIEMLLKAVLVNRNESLVEKPGRSIGLLQALKRAGSYSNGSSVEILRNRRDALQHAAQYTDAATTRDLFEAAMLFVDEVLGVEFNLAVPAALLTSRPFAETTPALIRVHASSRLQRDIASDGSVVAWAEGVAGGSELAVHVHAPAMQVRTLTPAGAFEYMPVTHAGRLAAYRQSGGIVVYDLASGTRSVISPSGGPTSIRGEWLAAQGIGVDGGLGGGIHLFNFGTGLWECVAEAGDSGVLSDEFIFWQVLEANTLVVKRRRLDGSDEPMTIARSATHPSVSERYVAWCDWPGGADPILHLAQLDGTMVRDCGVGIFPDVVGDRVAFLRPVDDTYGLIVLDVPSGETVVEIGRIGFPIGRGPSLGDSDVFVEALNGLSTHAIWRVPIV